VRGCTVISFPLGADVACVKRALARDAVERGADEIDMVIDVAAARMGDDDAIEREEAVSIAGEGRTRQSMSQRLSCATYEQWLC